MSGSAARIPVLVTGVGGGGHGEQIVKALKLAPSRYDIVGGDLSPYSAGLQNVDHPYLLPPAEDASYLDTVLKLCRRHGVKAVFHGSEPELRVLSAHQERFRDAGIFLPVNSPEVVSLCMDKVRTCERLSELGFAVPHFARVRSLENALDFDQLPAVLKPSRGGGGSADSYLVQDRRLLGSLAAELLAAHGEFIIQAYVGRPEEEYTVGVLLDMEGSLINSIGVRRYILSSLSNRIKVPNRTGRAELGPVLALSSGVSQGEIGRFPQVTAACEQIALALGARAAINIQLRLDAGKVVVFEINPRFSGTTSLRALVGYNEPDILVRKHVLGEEIPLRFAYQEGVILRSLAETHVERVAVPRASEL